MTDAELAAKIREITGQDDNFLAFVRSQYDRMAIKDQEGTWSVYIQINIDNYVTAIDSSAFISDPTNWLKIDEGTGEFYKYVTKYNMPGSAAVARGLPKLLLT